MVKRLKESQKLEILDGYRLGKSSIKLASEYGCTPNTVIRTVKGMLSEKEYKYLKKSRSKDKDPKTKDFSKKIKNLDSYNEQSQVINSDKAVSTDLFASGLNESVFEGKNVLDDLHGADLEKLALDDAADFSDRLSDESNDLEDFSTDEKQVSVFKELVPLISDFGFEEREQKVPLKELLPGVLPEVIYMLVDKKVELEFNSLRELPDWSFLPEDEKERQVISLFANQRAAKKNCSKGQRVIKVPNSNVFIISKSYLLSKGITRLVLDDSLIALDLD